MPRGFGYLLYEAGLASCSKSQFDYILHERGAAKEVIFPFCERFGGHEQGGIKPHLVL